MSRADFIRFEPHLPPLLPPPGGHRTRCERALASLQRSRLRTIGLDCLEHAVARTPLEPRLREVMDVLHAERQPDHARALLARLERRNGTLERVEALRQLAAMQAIDSLILSVSSEKPAHDLSFALAMLVASSDVALTELAWQSELLCTGRALERRVVQLSDWAPSTGALSLEEFVSGAFTRRLAGPLNLRIAQWLDAVPHGRLALFCQQLFALTVRELTPLLETSRAEELVRTIEVARAPDAAVRCLIDRWMSGPEPLGSKRAHALRAVADATRALVHPELAPMHASDAIKARAAVAENHVTSWVDSLNLLLDCTNAPTRL